MTSVEIDRLMPEPIIASRGHLNPDRIAFYMANIDAWEPVTVFDTGDALILADGHHRVEAARRLGRTTIKADIRRGTQHDALRFAINLGAEQRGLSEDEVIAAIRRQAGPRFGADSN
jgi:ParB-like chromosome segregation protein Spo0J